MRLIDADILKSAIVVDGYEHFSGLLSLSEVSLLEMVKDDIDEAPTVDAVPVVRCRECKYRFKNNGHDKSGCPIIDANIWMDDDDFCSHGERKEGADNG